MYQYLVDGNIRIADPYSTTILDEFNDGSIDEVTYPNLPDYPTGKTSHVVTLLRVGDDDFNWQANSYELPEKTDLIIYEILLRDFDDLHSFDALKARLDYLEELGVNAIELMPVNEFDANESWDTIRHFIWLWISIMERLRLLKSSLMSVIKETWP